MRADAPDLNPVERRQSGDAFATVFCPALRTALREVSAEWAPRWRAGSEGESSIDRVLMRLALLLDRVGDGSALYGNGGEQETLDHGDVRLLAAIRRSLLEQWRREDLIVDCSSPRKLIQSELHKGG